MKSIRPWKSSSSKSLNVMTSYSYDGPEGSDVSPTIVASPPSSSSMFHTLGTCSSLKKGNFLRWSTDSIYSYFPVIISIRERGKPVAMSFPVYKVFSSCVVSDDCSKRSWSLILLSPSPLHLLPCTGFHLHLVLLMLDAFEALHGSSHCPCLHTVCLPRCIFCCKHHNNCAGEEGEKPSGSNVPLMLFDDICHLFEHTFSWPHQFCPFQNYPYN